MTQVEILQKFSEIGVILKNRHLVYTSGRHGDTYVNKDAIYPHTEITSELCHELARRYMNDEIEVVVGPALGGIILSQWVAHHLSKIRQQEVLGVYAEKQDAGFVLRRGYDLLIRGKRVLLVEDVLTTGGSLKKLAEVAKATGALVAGAAALCNRGGVKAPELGVSRLDALVELDIPSWPPDACPLCQKKIPIDTSVGKGK